MVPGAGGITDMVTEKLALLARLPTLQVTAVGGVKAHGKFAGGVNVMPVGRVSVMTTLVAGTLPTLVTVTVNVRLEPRVTESGVAVVMSVKSEVLLIVTVPLEAELLAAFGSGSLPVTLAVLVAEPAAAAVTRIEMSTTAPLGMAPSEQTTGVGPEQAPWLDAAKASVTVGGSESVTTTPVASPGPLFLTDRL